MILLRFARKWWWVVPLWLVLEYVVAPLVIATLAPLVWGELVPRLAEVLR